MTRFFLASLAPVFLLGAGCDTPTEAPDQGADHDAEQLERALAVLEPPVVGGCSDIRVYGTSANDRYAVLLSVHGAYIEEAYDGGDTELSFVLPHPDIDLVVQWGSDLTVNECTDVFMDTPVVNGEAVAVEGTVHVDLDLLLTTPQPWDMSADATITMEDVVFQTESGAERTWSIDLGTTAVGWLPG